MKTKYEGFDILRNYFTSLDEKNILVKTNKNPYIPMNWIFTESIDRSVIQKTISNIMANNNENYIKRASSRNRKPEDIFDIEILSFDDGNFFLQFTGADGWTKLRITDEILDQYTPKIPIITLEKFEKEIQKTLKDSLIRGLSDNANLSATQLQQLTSFLNSQYLSVDNLSKIEQSGINLALNDAFKNLTKYYQFLIEEKPKHAEHICTIRQREDISHPNNTKLTKNQNTKTAPIRINPVIPFNIRAEILKNNNPSTLIKVNSLTEDNTIINNAYFTYVFKNPLGQINLQQNGYLFISEPLEGTTSTRLFFLTQDEFDEFPKKEGQDKYAEIVKHYLEMSPKEFERPGTVTISHTTPQSYSDKINFYIHGQKTLSTQTNLKAYEPKIQCLYANPSLKLPYYKPFTKEQIAKLGLNKQGLVDKTAQKQLENTQDKSLD